MSQQFEPPASEELHGAAPNAQYELDTNIGYLLRLCFQQSSSTFAEIAPRTLSAPRFAALARLHERGPLTQNLLGRSISADSATIKGIVDRLEAIGAVQARADPTDRRTRIITLTEAGQALYEQGIAASRRTAAALVGNLDQAEATTLVTLLRKVSARHIGDL